MSYSKQTKESAEPTAQKKSNSAVLNDSRPVAMAALQRQAQMATSAKQQALTQLMANQQSPLQRAEDEELLQGKFSPAQLAEDEELMQGKFATAQLAEDEELLQGKFSPVQLAEDEELMQGKFATAQRAQDEELLQGKFETTQRAEDEELLQGKFEPLQRAGVEEEEPLQGKFTASPTAQRVEQTGAKANNTGLPDQLKSGIENLSGMSMDHVKVHYNSPQPAQLNAHAYAQGSDIHVAPGQEQHLPHEAWHVVQQAQGRVKPTMQMKSGVPVNDDVGLESEADVMGAKALATGNATVQNKSTQQGSIGTILQKLKIGKEQVKTVTRLGELMGISKEEVVAQFNTALGNFPAATEVALNTYFNEVTFSVPVSISERDKFFGRLAKRYRDSYMTRTDSSFAETLKGIEDNDKFTTIMDKDGINYGDGEEDGASVKDAYDKSLACTLFAILELKPGFLGAATPKDLHQILRSNPKTKNYDLDPQVAQIRISAGLKYRAPAGTENTVSKFTSKVENRNKKFIIDPVGEAHTFALYYTDPTWKKYDNDNPGGVAPADVGIRVIWYV